MVDRYTDTDFADSVSRARLHVRAQLPLTGCSTSIQSSDGIFNIRAARLTLVQAPNARSNKWNTAGAKFNVSPWHNDCALHTSENSHRR
jgi:hypothetical protein